MSLTRLVNPDDPAVADLLGGLPYGSPAAQVLRVVEDRVVGWTVASRPGPSNGHAAVIAARSANCIDLATLVCACLRRCGTTRAYVLMGSPFGAFPVDAHTWAVFRDKPSGRAWLVDPPSLTATPLSIDFIRGVDPVAAWNDGQVTVGKAVLPDLIDALRLEE